MIILNAILKFKKILSKITLIISIALCLIITPYSLFSFSEDILRVPIDDMYPRMKELIGSLANRRGNVCILTLASVQQISQGDYRRVNLQPMTQTRIQDYLEKYMIWFNDPEVRTYLYPETPTEIETIQKWLEEITTNSNISYYAIFIDGRFVGHIGFREINSKNKTAEVGIMIGEKAMWSRHIGTEALRQIIEIGKKVFSLDVIYAEIYPPDNARSKTLFENFGFRLIKPSEILQ